VRDVNVRKKEESRKRERETCYVPRSIPITVQISSASSCATATEQHNAATTVTAIIFELILISFEIVCFSFCFFVFRVCVGRSTYCHVRVGTKLCGVCVWGAKIVYDCGVCEIVYDLGVPKYIVRSCFSFVLFSSVSVLEEVRTAT